MGCCLSSSKKHRRSPPPCSAQSGRDPPLPPQPEEETVKEVLSETPIPKAHIPNVPPVKEKEADFQQVKIESTAVVETKFESTAVIKPEVSEEPSEMCSFTESYSTTATATEKRDEDGEVTQRSPIRAHRRRQNSGDMAGVRERSFRSQAGRSAPSPEKRRSPASSKGAQGRGMTAQRRNVGPPNGSRRGPADSGSRRSKSPATRAPVDTRRNARYRSPAAREGDKPGGQSPARNMENESCSGNTGTPEKEEVPPESGESLENPLVSLECFIFL